MVPAIRPRLGLPLMETPIDRRELVKEPLHLRRVLASPNGYATGRAYWGTGKSLFEAFTDSGSFTVRVWARTRKVAKLNLVQRFGPLRFYH